MRIQLFYSILGLDSTKAFDIVIDEKQETVAIRQERDCKRTEFNKSIRAISYFFYLFDNFVEYQGIEETMHKFNIMKFNESSSSQNFSFFFDSATTLKKLQISHEQVGAIDFFSLRPVTKRSFAAEDFSFADCAEISEDVLNETGLFVSAMQTIIREIIDNQESILEIGNAELIAEEQSSLL